MVVEEDACLASYCSFALQTLDLPSGQQQDRRSRKRALKSAQLIPSSDTADAYHLPVLHAWLRSVGCLAATTCWLMFPAVMLTAAHDPSAQAVAAHLRTTLVAPWDSDDRQHIAA